MRLLTDKLKLLPSWFNYFDVVMLLVVGLHTALAARRAPARQRTGFSISVILLLMWAAISAALNIDRIGAAPAALFLFGLVEPILFMGLAFQLSAGQETVRLLENWLLGLGWLQFIVVAVLDLPIYLSTHNPDFINGTFGDNAYQLVHFLLAWNALFLFRESRSNRGLFHPRVIAGEAAVAIVILLAQFRSFLPFIALTWFITYLLVYRVSTRGLVRALVGLMLAVTAFVAIDRHNPNLKWSETLHIFERTDEIMRSGKVQSVLNYFQLLQAQPEVLYIGTGPARLQEETFASIRNSDRFQCFGANSPACGRWGKFGGNDLNPVTHSRQS